MTKKFVSLSLFLCFFVFVPHHKMSKIIDAVKRNDTQSLLLLIQSGGDVNEKDQSLFSHGVRKERTEGRWRERERRVFD